MHQPDAVNGKFLLQLFFLIKRVSELTHVLKSLIACTISHIGTRKPVPTQMHRGHGAQSQPDSFQRVSADECINGAYIHFTGICRRGNISFYEGYYRLFTPVEPSRLAQARKHLFNRVSTRT